jgi:hypothetical protein
VYLAYVVMRWKILRAPMTAWRSKRRTKGLKALLLREWQDV